MNVLIIEDEEIAAERLEKMLNQLEPNSNIIATIDGVEASVNWLNNNPAPDLIFADIHLSDGHSFDIFKLVEVQCPIIFTTAYDQYAIQAFKFNSIDYLLKPLKKEDLEASLNKYKKSKSDFIIPEYNKLLQVLETEKSYQKRLLIRFGHTIKTIEIDEVAYFYTEDRVSFACTKEAKKWPVDHTLDELESIIDPSKFFRINRQFIINVNAIQSMYTYSKSRVKLTLHPETSMETIVSTDRSPIFKEWLLGKN